MLLHSSVVVLYPMMRKILIHKHAVPHSQWRHHAAGLIALHHSFEARDCRLATVRNTYVLYVSYRRVVSVTLFSRAALLTGD